MVVAKKTKKAAEGNKPPGSATNIPLCLSTHNGKQVPLWVPVLLCVSILQLDISMPRGIASGIAYIPLVFCGLWFSYSYSTFIFAAIASLLALIALTDAIRTMKEYWFGIALLPNYEALER